MPNNDDRLTGSDVLGLLFVIGIVLLALMLAH